MNNILNLTSEIESLYIALLIVLILLIITSMIVILSRYKKCPSDKIMVIYGKVGKNKDGTFRSAICLHGGAAFIWPIFQNYALLDLTPISFSIDLKNVKTSNNEKIQIFSRWTVGISTESGVMQSAAERLLGLRTAEIQGLAYDIICGQIRLACKLTDFEEVESDEDKFFVNLTKNVEQEIVKIGLRLINVNVSDICNS